jgi:hypothetical protein
MNIENYFTREYKDTEDKLIYGFDRYNQKPFYIELNEIEMEKTMNATVVALNKGIAPIQTHAESNEAKLIEKEDQEVKNASDDLGEIEDLYEIYGEMSSTL